MSSATPAVPGAVPGLEGCPPPLRVEGARETIRRARRRSGGRTVVLDDDPTGSQSVHDVEIVTALDPAVYASALGRADGATFVLTNTRGMQRADAVELTATVARDLLRISEREGFELDMVSRSDSTLRGHILDEVRALDDARREVLGRGYDGVIVAPALFAAGRVTAGSVHWAKVAGEYVPVADTEFARDATFGYASSDLRDFIVEKSGGTVRRDDISAVTLTDIREGGPDRVARMLADVADGRFVVLDGIEDADYEVAMLGILRAQEGGRRFLMRTGPSFVAALIGSEPRALVTAAEIWPAGRPRRPGLIIAGSHVAMTGRQLDRVRQAGRAADIEFDVAPLLDPGTRDAHVRRTVERVRDALRSSDVMVYTSRRRVDGAGPEESLAIAQAVSTALVAVVQGVLASRPGWVVAKGGITSHDVAVRGLGIRRAALLGQLRPGVSVMIPSDSADLARGVPFIIFPGNVGDESSLLEVVTALNEQSA
ncbi:MAG: four-carbon acid sugar kinase family protein [Microbacterium sp.]|uniref:four-carbon acid sugar kinase family protein n=1 Tax=Microbacterium sp. TaxID=51671 RepID=UPI0039E2C204